MPQEKKYTPNYPDSSVESDVPNISGRSPRANIEIEESAQKEVAESKHWMLARRINGSRGDSDDTRKVLEELGFIVNDSDDSLFYRVTPPEGWTKSTSGYWTTVTDAQGNERISMFFKGAWYDRDAFLNVR